MLKMGVGGRVDVQDAQCRCYPTSLHISLLLKEKEKRNERTQQTRRHRLDAFLAKQKRRNFTQLLLLNRLPLSESVT